MTVAVYGSLKHGYGNHGTMVRAGGKFLHTAISVDDHYILDGHGYPYINEDHDNPLSAPLAVELYNVPRTGLLNDLDRLEGHPTFYKRELRRFITPTGKARLAWIYILVDTVKANVNYIKDGVYNW